ncbi:GumC family protein [Oceanicella actignis]|uniref:GumC family protein n=1 Tax=Oceanicella actignis TaxID=1189325 RepID=UPI0011E75C03|nr:polysaccharide biosynthesis tyrosine autokinase [Oceanicella actignis]TYO90573.1 capsular exopolysaccharide synthesis family protein [Oceanicella actignis]
MTRQAPIRDASRAAAMAAAAEEDSFDLRETLRTLWRKRRLIALLTAAQLGLALWHLTTATPYYEAVAKVMLDTSENQVIDLQAVAGGLSSDYEMINTQIEVLQSRALLGRVVDKLGLENDPEFNPDLAPDESGPLSAALDAARAALGGLKRLLREEEAPPAAAADEFGPEFMRRQTAIDLLQGAMSAVNIDGSYVFEISVWTEDPVKSARIANAIAEQYILDQLEVKFEATRKATEWLSARVAELKEQLERAEAAVKDFSARAALVSPQALAAKERQIKDLRARLAEMSAQLDDVEARLARARAAADGAERARLLGLGADAPQARIDAALAALEADRDRLARQVALVRDSLAQLEDEVRAQSRDLVQLMQLQREAEASRLIYEHFLSRMKETSVQQGIQQADARILSEAIPPAAPGEPRWKRTLALALVGGLMLSTLIVLTAGLLRSVVRSREELEALTGEAVLGVIPVAPTRRRRALAEYMTRKPSSRLAEAVRDLRTAILMSDLDDPPQVIMTTSSMPGEGKSTTALLLAQNSAMMGRKVLAMECDLRRTVFAEYFPAARDRPGLMKVLAGQAALDEALHVDEASGLHVLRGERSAVNAADAFSSARFGELIDQLRQRYDMIVIDTPPVLAVPDARVISRHADAVLFVVRWNVTRREMIAASLTLLRQVKARVAGLALTQADPRRMAREGFYGYGPAGSNRYYQD